MLESGVIPNAIMIKDDHGQYLTVNDAIISYSKKNQDRFIIYINTVNDLVIDTNLKIDDESILIFLRV